jgi:hypothetical protein
MRVPMSLTNLLNDRFLTLLAHGGDTLDWSAIGDLAARDAVEGVRPVPMVKVNGSNADRAAGAMLIDAVSIVDVEDHRPPRTRMGREPSCAAHRIARKKNRR